MNNKVLWVVGLIIVVAVAAYLMMSTKKTGNQPTNNGTTSNSVKNDKSEPEQVTKASSLKDLIALGTSQKCTFSSEGSEGTMYVAGGKSRGDFSTTAAGSTSKGHMMFDGKMSYVWMDGQTQGYKMSLDSVDGNKPTNAPTNTPTQSGVDYDKQMDYSCEKWSADNSMFVLPSNVEFLDIAAMMDSSKMMEDALNKAKQ